MTGPEVVSDVERCLDMYDALGSMGYDDTMAMVTIPGAPWSKARPRFGKGRTFTSRDDVDAEKRTGTYLRQAVTAPFMGNVFIGCLFFRPNRQRIDTDNLLKHVCDAATGILWKDDSQCTGLMGVLELDPERPRTVVIIGRHQSTLKRGVDAFVDCLVCQGPIYLDQCNGKVRKTCSPECRAKAQGKGYATLREPVECPQCGQPFKRSNHAQKLCSEQCRRDLIRGKARAAWSPFSRCVDCDKELAHRRGGRCRECWKVNLKVVDR